MRLCSPELEIIEEVGPAAAARRTTSNESVRKRSSDVESEAPPKKRIRQPKNVSSAPTASAVPLLKMRWVLALFISIEKG